MSDTDRSKMKTLSDYYTSTAEGKMMPSAKLVKQDREREEAMDKIQDHRQKALTVFEGNTVLVCDPNIKDRMLISENLKKAGYIVFVATDWKECERILKTIPVKAVIVDARFQGVEMIRKINGSTKIILSGDDNLANAAIPDAERVTSALAAVAAVIEA
ncbi:MAG: hypothetical protein V3W09_00850 [Nitrososphaerales archaeon]